MERTGDKRPTMAVDVGYLLELTKQSDALTLVVPSPELLSYPLFFCLRLSQRQAHDCVERLPKRRHPQYHNERDS